MSGTRCTSSWPGRLLLGLLLAAGADVRAECRAYIGAQCSPPRGDAAQCLFGLQSREASPSPPLPPVTVAFVSDPAYEVSPVSLELNAGSTAAATVTVNRAHQPLGLIQLRGTATGLPLECATIDRPLDFSQPGAFRIEVIGTGLHPDKGQPQEVWLVPGHEEQLEIRVLDQEGAPVKGNPVPLTLVVTALHASAEFLQHGQPASSEAKVLLPAGDFRQLVLMRPLKPGSGRLQVVAKLDGSPRALATAMVGFRSEYTWSRRLSYALLGGACFWLLRLLRVVAGAKRALLALGGALLALGETLLASGVGFAIQDYLPQMGLSFRADPSRLDGQIFLGMLLAGLGTEGLLGLVRGRLPRPETAALGQRP